MHITFVYNSSSVWVLPYWTQTKPAEKQNNVSIWSEHLVRTKKADYYVWVRPKGGFTLGTQAQVRVTWPQSPVRLISANTSVTDSCPSPLEKAVSSMIHVCSGMVCRRCESNHAQTRKWAAMWQAVKSRHDAPLWSSCSHDVTVNFCACKEGARKFWLVIFNTYI